VVVLEEGGVAVHLAPEALAEDEVGVASQARVELGARVPLDAVVGPEDLGP
jgi:hypothetical protein